MKLNWIRILDSVTGAGVVSVMACFADLNLLIGDNSYKSYEGIRSAINRECIA